MNYGLYSFEQRPYTKAYCDRHFTKISKGSARHVYDMGDGRAIKIAIGDKGLEQNRAEIEVFRDYDYCAPIFEWCYDINQDENLDYKWIIVGKCERGVKNADFVKHFGVTRNELIDYCKKLDDYLYRLDGTVKLPDYKEDSLFEGIFQICANMGMMASDFGEKSSWGFYNGELVILDAGLTHECYREYYDIPRRKKAGLLY